ncbi:MAG TPA: hypothetical protein VMW07_04970 [Gallionella sp.]|jgi:hypothetical protein|nr:hypothetical protein [Gallionella sp.]
MIILRLFLVLVALSLILSGAIYVFTRNSYYLRLAWQIIRFSIFLLLVLALLYVLERYVLIGWRAIL